MQNKQEYRWLWKMGWLYCSMMMGLVQLSAQTFAEALRAGQTIRVEWTLQELEEENGTRSRKLPLFPNEMEPGESEVRLGLQLKSVGAEQRLVAEISYVRYLEIPESKEKSSTGNTTDKLSYPIILDTRFQDAYFDPQLYRLAILSEQVLPLGCEQELYERFLDGLDKIVEEHAERNLLPEQREWLQATLLPASLSAPALSDFFCQLMKAPVPTEENIVQLPPQKGTGIHRISYLQVDDPPKLCLLRGHIESPAAREIRVQFFQEGNWLTYWQDSLLELDQSGNFELAFPLDAPRILTVFHGYQAMRFYFAPGDSLQFTTNANAFYQEMSLSGTVEVENTFLLDFYHEMRGDTVFNSFDYDLLEYDHRTYFQQLQTRANKEFAFLSKYASSLRPEFATLIHQRLQLEQATREWEAAYRFMVEAGVTLEPTLLQYLQEKATLLYQLPPGKHYDFFVEDYLSFQFYLLQDRYESPRLGARQEQALAQLLPSKETYVRHSVMQLFRQYSDLGALTQSGQWRLSQLLGMTQDTALIQEMRVFAEGEQEPPRAFSFRTLPKGREAPDWSFTDQEGLQVALRDFTGKDLLLHIGWADNLDIALSDIEYLQDKQEQLPEMVHLLTANNKDQFNRAIAGKEGLFVFVSSEKWTELEELYFIDNKSNHYFLIGADGKILANNYTLGTARKLRGAWEQVAEPPSKTSWTPEQRLQFWQGLGMGALVLFLMSGIILWRRRITMQRDLRRRQLLEVELRGIRSQMNPHFLFNAMSAIQNLIRKQEQEKADLYLGQFAGLMRKILRNSAEAYIPLADEIESLEQYCSLESLRHPFDYSFQIEESIDAQNTYIPSMILQPIIENAILHGLAPQTGPRKLQVRIIPGKAALDCTVTDNGIGFYAASEKKKGNTHQSLGVQLIRQRLELMGLKGAEHLTIRDRSTLDPPARGTQVSLTIPVEQ